MKLDRLGEGGLIRKIRERFKAAVVVPIGDDAAVFDVRANESLIFCSDLLVEKRHFVRDLHPPDAVAYKSIAANVSDVGAMGGTPLHFLISLAAPGNLDVTWIDAFLDGVARACADFDISLLGGDSSSSDEIFVDVSMIGSIPPGKAIRRAAWRFYLPQRHGWRFHAWPGTLESRRSQESRGATSSLSSTEAQSRRSCS